MVIIPAGCAHEVINIAPVAKFALDFFPASSIDRCLKVQADRVAYFGEEGVGKGDLIRAPARVLAFLLHHLSSS
ncbi:hypothetical protein JCM5350_002399 [Sporobolomyces pararoseus]